MCKTDVYFFEDEMDSGFRNLAQSSAIFLFTTLLEGTLATSLNNNLLINIYHEVHEFGMTFEVSLYEWAIDFYGQMVGPGVIECIRCQRRSDAMAADFFRDFGMHEYDLAVG